MRSGLLNDATNLLDTKMPSAWPGKWNAADVRRSRVLLVLGVGALVLVAATAAVGWHLSSVAMRVDTTVRYNLDVLRVDGDTVTLASTRRTVRPGRYGLSWPNGSAILGNITSMDNSTVTRRLESSTADLASGQKVRWLDDVWLGDPKSALSIDFQTVAVPTALGDMPAWFVPGASDTWTIVVHGRGVGLSSTLRVLPALQRSGTPVLVPSHRNDAGAPEASGGQNHFGASEWRDIDAAVTYARQHGAARVVLFGGSTGAAIASQILHESESANVISGMIMDSPVLDWRNTLEYQAGKKGIPLVVTRVGQQFLTWRTGMNFDDFDQVRRAGEFNIPILLLVGTDDDVVPTDSAKSFAEKRPDIVKFEQFDGAGHGENWNADSNRYEALLSSFLNERV